MAADYTHRSLDDPDMLLSSLINDIEADKGRDHIEYDDLKEAYHAGRWRTEGYTKRQIEDRMQRLNGKVLGIETALRILYLAQAQREGTGND